MPPSPPVNSRPAPARRREQGARSAPTRRCSPRTSWPGASVAMATGPSGAGERPGEARELIGRRQPPAERHGGRRGRVPRRARPRPDVFGPRPSSRQRSDRPASTTPPSCAASRIPIGTRLHEHGLRDDPGQPLDDQRGVGEQVGSRRPALLVIGGCRAVGGARHAPRRSSSRSRGRPSHAVTRRTGRGQRDPTPAGLPQFAEPAGHSHVAGGLTNREPHGLGSTQVGELRQRRRRARADRPAGRQRAERCPHRGLSDVNAATRATTPWSARSPRSL